MIAMAGVSVKNLAAERFIERDTKSRHQVSVKRDDTEIATIWKQTLYDIRKEGGRCNIHHGTRQKKNNDNNDEGGLLLGGDRRPASIHRWKWVRK